MDEAVNVRCYVLPFIDYGLGYFDDATSGIGLTIAPTVLGRFSEYASRPIARIGCVPPRNHFRYNSLTVPV
jgi:hypothetical protein